jgi:hypothetical protein
MFHRNMMCLSSGRIKKLFRYRKRENRTGLGALKVPGKVERVELGL